MNSDTWLPTAAARVTLTEPPVNTESVLRMHANQTYIESAQTDLPPDSRVSTKAIAELDAEQD
jgi:hypothetical protein